MSIQTVLDVGTGKLNADDHVLLEHLSAMDSQEYEAPRTTATQYGYVMWLGDKDSRKPEIADLRKRGASKGLLDIVKYAQKNNVFMINLDKDGDDLEVTK